MSKPVGNIASVAKRTGKVALQNVSIQVLVVPAVNGFKEISVMTFAATELFDDVPLFFIRIGVAIVGHDDGAAFAFNDHSHAFASESRDVFALEGAARCAHQIIHILLILRARQAADFEDQGRFLVIMKNDLRIRRGAVVDVAEAAAETEDARRKLVLAQEPAGDIHLVNALISQIAVARIPNPMPIVMEALAHERLHRGRAAPEIVVDAGRNWLRSIDLADAGTPLVAKPARDKNFSEIAGLHPLDSLANSGAGTALRSCLHNFVVRARELNELPAFPNVVTNRLFYIDIFARLNSPNRRQGVPMIRRGD